MIVVSVILTKEGSVAAKIHYLTTLHFNQQENFLRPVSSLFKIHHYLFISGNQLKFTWFGHCE
jgi:hypothetical protein